MKEHLFLTGGTGFVGSRIRERWLDRTDARISVLTRNVATQEPCERIRWIRGDLAAPRLGIAPADRADLIDTVTHIVHAGADLRFDRPLEEARRTNTAGTAAILDLARSCRHLRRLDHVGTAFAAGCSSGIVREDAYPDNLEHHNSYERSKYEAERLVRDAMADLPVCVLRPSVVTCDPRTGYAPARSAFYRMLRAIAGGVLEVLPGQEDNCLDLVTVDYVADAAFAIGRRDDLAGESFHLAAGADGRIRLGDLRDLVRDGLGCDRLEILSPPEFAAWVAAVRRTKPESAAFLDELALYAPYLGDHPVFDDRNARRALQGAGVRTASIVDYFQRVAAYVC